MITPLSANNYKNLQASYIRRFGTFFVAFGKVSVFGIIVFLSGCITPPPAIHSSVLNQSELDLATALNKGRNYLQSGRYDLAEKEFRYALKLEPDLAVIYNDLGYALMLQNRNAEAVDFYNTAIQYDPVSISSRINLAHAYYRLGMVEHAIREYQELLYGAELTARTKGRVRLYLLTPQDIAMINRNLAAAYYQIGDLDEAICRSKQAVGGGVDQAQVGQHVRMLLSVDRNKEALSFVRKAVESLGAGAMSRVLVDYGIALYVTGDKTLAREAARRVVVDPTLETEDRITAYLLLLLTAQNAQDSDFKANSDALLDTEQDLCLDGHSIRYEYWPTRFSGDVVNLIKRLCDEQLRVSS